MKTIIINVGRILTDEEIKEEAKKQGINIILMIQHFDGCVSDEERMTYEVTGWA